MFLEGILNTEQATLGTLIAVLRRSFPPILTVEQIQEGLRVAKLLDIQDDIIREGEGKSKYKFRTGNKDNVAAGTALRITTEGIKVPEGVKVTVLAKPGNNGIIYFGNSKAECEESGKRFDGLDAGLAHSFDVTEVGDIWFDASITGEGISWYTEQ